MKLEVKIGQRQQVIPDGDYLARVIKIERKAFINNRPTFEFSFEIVEGEHKGTILRGFVNANYETFTEYSKLCQWLKVVNKDLPEPGESIDLTCFDEKVIKVRVVAKKSKKTKNIFSNVVDILQVVHEL